MIRNESESTAAYKDVREDTFNLTFLYQAPVIRVLFSMIGMSADNSLHPIYLFRKNGPHQHMRQRQLAER